MHVRQHAALIPVHPTHPNPSHTYTLTDPLHPSPVIAGAVRVCDVDAQHGHRRRHRPAGVWHVQPLPAAGSVDGVIGGAAAPGRRGGCRDPAVAYGRRCVGRRRVGVSGPAASERRGSRAIAWLGARPARRARFCQAKGTAGGACHSGMMRCDAV
eukprot:365806-Chlamydomonas_euryale.AAC.20